MSKKKEKILNWINFATALVGILAKIVKEIIDIIPTKEAKK